MLDAGRDPARRARGRRPGSTTETPLRAGPEVPEGDVDGGLGEGVAVEAAVQDRQRLRRVRRTGADDPRGDEVLEHPLRRLGRLAAPDRRGRRLAEPAQAVVAGDGHGHVAGRLVAAQGRDDGPLRADGVVDDPGLDPPDAQAHDAASDPRAAGPSPCRARAGPDGGVGKEPVPDVGGDAEERRGLAQLGEPDLDPPQEFGQRVPGQRPLQGARGSGRRPPRSGRRG